MPDLEMIFRDHCGSLVRALAVVGPDAADVVQEAFVQAHLHWRKVREYEDPVGWIRRVAVNQMLSRRRSAKRERSAMSRMYRDDVVSEELAGQMSLRTALSTLPPQQRMAVSLFYLGDLSLLEVAAAMELSVGAVKYHLHAARAALRARLEVPDGA